MDHVQRGAAFGMTVSLSQVALLDEARAVQSPCVGGITQTA